MPRSLCAAQRGGRHCPNGIIIAARGGLVNAEHAAHPLCQGALRVMTGEEKPMAY